MNETYDNTNAHLILKHHSQEENNSQKVVQDHFPEIVTFA